ncbi:hypothetical protein V1277_002840 [Bradyrhizobium sp. AZCC 1588]|uniref:Pvc16 family protein n=1 Tax=unclassified Bradyrhizobium TaxID=2631580 RepID=UPI002FF15842
MQARAIQRVTRAMAQRIETKVTAVPGFSDRVIVGPPNSPKAKDALIILFPYRLVASPALRNVERILPPKTPADGPQLFEHALPLDVFYLVTTGSISDEPADAQVGLQETLWESLGLAIQALQDGPFLVGEEVEGDTVRLSLEPVTTEELNRIWSLFPNVDYRTSVVYLASPVWIDALETPVAGPVVDDRRNVGQRAAGSVRAA